MVGLPESSKSRAKAAAAGLTVLTPSEAAKAADFIMILVPDHLQADIYEADIAPNLKAGKTLMFAHGFSIHFKAIEPPADIDVSMVAPKAPGHRVREVFTEGSGVPAIVAVAPGCERQGLRKRAGLRDRPRLHARRRHRNHLP